MEKFKIFIVEDDPWYGEMLRYHLARNPDYDVRLFSTGSECLQNIGQDPHVITVDFNLPDMNGEQLLLNIKKHWPDLPVIIISSQEEIKVVLGLLKKGAFDYLVKDQHTKDYLWNSIVHLREKKNLQDEVKHLRSQLNRQKQLQMTLLGNSSGIQGVLEQIKMAARTNINVAITGETGTGKEVVARAIHTNSSRQKHHFIAINLAAIPSELLESELFGHEKGAFTGASALKKGKFELAHRGTLFLDEIAEAEPHIQVKLLRVLQEKQMNRVGGHENIHFDARLITATHRNLAELVEAGKFRSDLYYRIIGLPIALPPLRERGHDIVLLAQHFANSFNRENGLPNPELSADACSKLLDYDFPGNVRELKSIIELACAISSEGKITADHLHFQAVQARRSFLSKEKTLKAYNTEIISHYLQKYDQNVLEVARVLDIGKSTIYNMIKQGSIKTQA